MFQKRYKAMHEKNKWLESGRYVEDVVYKLGEKYHCHHLLHSFIFDVEDKFTCSGFTEKELEEIHVTNERDLPDLDPDLLTFIEGFAKTRQQRSGKSSIVLTRFSMNAMIRLFILRTIFREDNSLQLGEVV